MSYNTPPPYVPGPGPGPTPPPFGPTPPPARRGRGLRITLISIAAALLLCVVGGIIAVATQHNATPDAKKAATQAPLPQDPCGGGVCTTTPVADSPTTTAAVPLKASDIQLTVKIKTKDCFGSAGCNVEYTIKAAIGQDVEAQDCEVTYDVHGLEDTQTGTLDFHADGTYEQDSYQSGETSSSKKKLTAKVTEVDCS